MLAAGEIAAAIGVEVDHPDVRPLIPDAEEAGLRALRERGVYPINHLIVVKDELLTEHGDLAADVFDAFARAKQVYLERLRSGAIEKPTAIDKLHRDVMAVTGDPLPYGIEPNRQAIETLIRHAHDQHIISRRFAAEELFAPATYGLIG